MSSTLSIEAPTSTVHVERGAFSLTELDAKLHSVQVYKEFLQPVSWTCNAHIVDVLLPDPPCVFPAVTFASSLHHFLLPVKFFGELTSSQNVFFTSTVRTHVNLSKAT